MVLQENRYAEGYIHIPSPLEFSETNTKSALHSHARRFAFFIIRFI